MIKTEYMEIDDASYLNGVLKITHKLKTNKKVKLEVTKDNKNFYYNFISNPIQIPLQLGAGVYQLKLYKNIAANAYEEKDICAIRADDMDENAYMLSSNQYVNIKLAQPILKKIPKEKNAYAQMKRIKHFIKTKFAYDYIKAFNIKKGMLPDISGCITNHKGICQDFAALAVAICRNFQIPASLVIGYGDNMYHAWVRVIIDGQAYRYDPTKDLTNKKVNKYIKERWY